MTTSSMAEQRAVNSKVPGSSPGWSAEGEVMQQTRKSENLYKELTAQIVEEGSVPCQEAPDLFFLDKGDPIGPDKMRMSKQLCGSCPVRFLCLEYALEANEYDGIWGGLTRNERQSLKRSRIKRERVY
jgi:WhiB family transcriptional regulator, redox-sensing transcriptional regulator